MDVKEKVVAALKSSLKDAYIRLEGEDGITGFVVSDGFKGMKSLDRQMRIDELLTAAPEPLTRPEHRRILMIAALTPIEYDSVGTPVRIRKVKELRGGGVEIVLHGTEEDARYVREAFDRVEGLRTTKPKDIPDAEGILMSFRVKGSEVCPSTRDRALRILATDRYVEVMPNA